MLYINNNIPVVNLNDQQVIEHVRNMFFHAMMKWKDVDSLVGYTFKVNCYNARLKLFLSKLHHGANSVNLLNGLR